jgi:hypothetical protein
MPKNLTPKEKADREKFVFSQIQAGLSRKQIELSICDKFKVANRTAVNIYGAAVDKLIDYGPGHQRRNRAVILEVFHAQVDAFQAEIQAIQDQIEVKLNLQRQRQVILDKLLDGSFTKAEQKVLEAELKAFPEVRPNVICQMIGAKGRLRGQLVDTLGDIARVQGLYAISPVVEALHVLAEHEILSPELSFQLVQIIEGVSDSIVQAFHKSPLVLNGNQDDFGDADDSEYTQDHLSI